jgi:hypothetical protein
MGQIRKLLTRRCTYDMGETSLQGRDLNPRPPGYEPGELPDCSTLRRRDYQGKGSAFDQLFEGDGCGFGDALVLPEAWDRARCRTRPSSFVSWP